MQEETDYKGLYMINGKYIKKATCYKNGCLYYVPLKGVAHYLQKDYGENLGKLNFVIVKDYGNFYKEYATDTAIAKGMNHNVPMYIDEDAELKPITVENAKKTVKKTKNY